MLDNIKNIAYIVYASIMTLITFMNYFLGKSKVKKANGKTEEANEELKDTNALIDGLKGQFEVLGDFLIKAMEQAEESGMTGLGKKAYVISLVIQKCAELNLNYNSIKDIVASKIEELVEFSKRVNSRKEEITSGTNGETEIATERFE